MRKTFAFAMILLPLVLLSPSYNGSLNAPIGARPINQSELAVQESSSCARCHSNAPRATAMKDARGREISPFDLWQGTMMANSARDPLWRAVVSAEIAATPSQRREIEAKCLSCHAPMAHHVGLDDHDTGSLMHVLDCDSNLGHLARDGVSCTVCHGMSPADLGTETSFSGGFHLDNQQRLFGPHQSPFSMPMRHHTGFTPTYSAHVTESALCASCHTLETEALDPRGRAVGARLLEQAPYLEWLNSDYRDTGPRPGAMAASCQDCHVPTSDEDGNAIQTRIARNPGGRDFPPTQPRSPFGRHVFVGGNTLVLGMLRDNAEQLRVSAPPSAIQATLQATRNQLQHHTATIAIEAVQNTGGAFSFDVNVENLTGHKLPTAHPTRRAWLQVLVRGEGGAVLFASGATDEMGRIVGAKGKPLSSELAGGPIAAHRDTVRTADQVAIYQAVMSDADGAPTHTLLRGASWLMDNRLLPKGWSSDHPDAMKTAPIGVKGDTNFEAGRDRVRFEIPTWGKSPASVEVALLYQPLSARWAAELLRWETPEIDTFRQLYERAELSPEVLATARWKK